MTKTNKPVPRPTLQISFFDRLQGIQSKYLNDALARAVDLVALKTLDGQLDSIAASRPLKLLARSGVRGEIFYPAPCILNANPLLLGYYRLLYGFSQKEFYKSIYFGPYKSLEVRGVIPDKLADSITELCGRCGQIADELILGISDRSLATVRDLQLLTLGPQFRGIQNTILGQDASLEVYQLIRLLLGKYITKQTERAFEIVNDSHRKVLIEFSSDPDIRILEQMKVTQRYLVSIEIKGGGDFSNIHNRLGEAEKSHQKAKTKLYHEFWTIHRVNIPPETARKASPTTTSFFNLDAIQDPKSDQAIEFREKLASLLSIQIPAGI